MCTSADYFLAMSLYYLTQMQTRIFHAEINRPASVLFPGKSRPAFSKTFRPFSQNDSTF
jgi:hypothetical protein